MSKPYYLAGPMTGIPQFNYPAFDSAAKMLRVMGYEIRSPAEMDCDAVRKAAMSSADGSLGSGLVDDAGEKHTWGDFLSRDVKLIADECGGIIMLDGWEKSKGARMEVYVAMQCGYPIHFYHEGIILGMRYMQVLEELIDHTLGKDPLRVAA